MGRHSAPEGRHRRTGALLAQAGLVAVLGLVAVSVLFGSAIVRDRMVSGTFAGSETAAESSPGVETAATSPEPSPASSAPATRTAPPAAGSDEPTPTADSSDQAIVPESRGASESSAPTSTASAPPTAAAPEATTGGPNDPSVDVKPMTTAPKIPQFANCADAKAAGVSMIPDADPRYDPKLDHDGDGFACDAHGDPPTRHRPSTTPTSTPTACPPPER